MRSFRPLRRLALGLASLALAASPALAGTFDDAETSGSNSNDSTATATVLNLSPGNNTIRGDITEADDVDFFALNLPALGLTSFSVFDPAGGDAGPADYVLALYDPDGSLYIADDNSGSGGSLGGDPMIVADIQRAGTWYIAVSIFDYVPLPFAIGAGFGGPQPGPGPGGVFTAPHPFRDPAGLLPGEVGEFKLDPALTGGGRIGPFFGEDDYAFLGSIGFLDPPFVITVIANPEPGTLALFGLGLLGLAGVGYRRRKKRVAAITSAA